MLTFFTRPYFIFRSGEAFAPTYFYVYTKIIWLNSCHILWLLFVYRKGQGLGQLWVLQLNNLMCSLYFVPVGLHYNISGLLLSEN